MLGAVPNPEEVFTVSMEADICPYQAPELAEKKDGSFGVGSQFHQTYGYYAQGVGPETATLPEGWFDRVNRVQNSNTAGRVAYCLDVRDLFLSKAVAGRDKDCGFCMALFEHCYVTPAQVLELVASMPIDDKERRALRARIRRWANTVRDAGHNVPEA